MSLKARSPVKFLPLGAIIQEFWIGGRNIVLGFSQQDEYQTRQHPYFGETIGRIPNRLSNGMMKDLNGRDYGLARNEREATTLHGGSLGWGKKIWSGPHVVTRRSQESILFTLRSSDGDEGFPGEVEARVWYTVDHQTKEENKACRRAEEITLDIEYEIEMMGEEADVSETVCSMTNHGYWNLSGGPTVAGMEVHFETDLYLEVDDLQIPTGEITSHPAVEKGRTIPFSETEPAIDDCFILDRNVQQVPIDTRGLPLRRYASMLHAGTGLGLEAATTEPSFQFYSGDGIHVPKTATGVGFGRRAGIALEPNRYVNAVNVPEWRSMVLLKRGQRWGCRNQFRAWRE